MCIWALHDDPIGNAQCPRRLPFHSQLQEGHPPVEMQHQIYVEAQILHRATPSPSTGRPSSRRRQRNRLSGRRDSSLLMFVAGATERFSSLFRLTIGRRRFPTNAFSRDDVRDGCLRHRKLQAVFVCRARRSRRRSFFGWLLCYCNELASCVGGRGR